MMIVLQRDWIIKVTSISLWWHAQIRSDASEPLKISNKPEEHLAFEVFVFINITGWKRIWQNKEKRQIFQNGTWCDYAAVKRTSTYHQTLVRSWSGVMMIYSEWGTARVLSTSRSLYWIWRDVFKQADHSRSPGGHVKCHSITTTSDVTLPVFWLLNPAKYIDIHRTYRSFFFGSLNIDVSTLEIIKRIDISYFIYTVWSVRSHGWTFQNNFKLWRPVNISDQM